MDGLTEVDFQIDPINEHCQDFIHKIEKPCKAGNDDDDDDCKDDEDGDNSSHVADSSSPAVDVASGNEKAEVAMTTLATELTDDEINDVQEMGDKLQALDINTHSTGDISNVSESQNQDPSDQQVETVRPNSNETDVDDIMSESFTLVTAVNFKSNGIGGNDLDDDQTIKQGVVLEDEDDEDDMKELLRFKRQNSRDYLEQAPIDGLLEGIAEEPEEEGAKEIEEEYDSVVIKDEEYESGSGSDAANETGKETEESETAEDQSPSLVDVVKTDAAVVAKAIIVDVEGEEDSEINLETSQTLKIESNEELKQTADSSNDGDQIVESRVENEETKTEEKVAVEISAEPMDTTTSPSSSEPTSENATTLEGSKESAKPPADESLIDNEESKNKNHDYVNIGQLGSSSNNLDGFTASKAEISDEDFNFEPPEGFDEVSVKSSDQPDVSYDYVNVDTIRANKRLVSRLIQEGNDEEFERLEAEIISKLEDEEDSDYCIPKPNPVEVKSDDLIFQQFSDINGSAATDENENLSSSDHQDLTSAEAALDDGQLDEIKPMPMDTFSDQASKNERNVQPSVTSAVITDIGKYADGKTIKENGNIDYDSDVSHDYKYPIPCEILSRHEGRKEDSSTYRDINSSTDSFGTQQQVKKSSLKSDQSRLASPVCESSYGSRSNDILPEAGSVKALVAQWQQLENRRWSRKDDMKVKNGGESPESRGMNRSRSCGPLPRKIRVLSPDGVLDDEGRRISDWTVVTGSGDIQEQYNSQPSLTRAMLVKFERLDYETSSTVNAPPIQKKTYKWEVKEPKTLSRPSFLAH